MRTNKIALFVDGPNTNSAAKALGFDIDFRRLLAEFEGRGTVLRAYYYATDPHNELSSTRPLLDWLDYNGYTVVSKGTKEFIAPDGRHKVKGNMNVELAVDVLEVVKHVEQIVLFSGDGAFSSLVAAAQRQGVHVTVVSTISTRPPIIADELRRQANNFADLVELQSNIRRV
jgi:uncharacterized LabA/DUF88 family protein